jgi:hypothetical protein
MQRARAQRTIHHRVAVPIALLFTLTIVSQASGHGVRLPFNQWGGFNASTARCQRMIARAATQCATTAWRAARLPQRRAGGTGVRSGRDAGDVEAGRVGAPTRSTTTAASVR